MIRGKQGLRPNIAIVGGGISGLYCAYHLAQNGMSIHLYEASKRLGGRIETWKVDDELHAEFGPMRIEPRHQPLLNALLRDTLEFTEDEIVSFPPYASQPPEQPRFELDGEEEEQKNLLDMLRLGLRRIFSRVNPVPRWTAGAQYPFQAMISQADPVRAQWKQHMSEWITALQEKDIDTIRRRTKIADTFLWDIGFWNLLSDALSHMAVTKIRDWGSFYHLLPENPNAAEWIIFWLRALQTSEDLRGVKGGMSRIVAQLRHRLTLDSNNNVRIHMGKRLLRLDPVSGKRVRLVFEDGSAEADHVILAIPKEPLTRLGPCLQSVSDDLNSVFGFPLLKCFFVLQAPWWDDDRPPNTYASNIPTRELHYWKRTDGTKGMIMLYTDRPGTQFWSDYLPRSDAQQVATKWSRHRRNRRLERKFIDYLYQNEVEEKDFRPENLLAYGMRDWARVPYGGACHAWRPGRKSWEVMDRLQAFALTKRGPRNVHICGEAYSDYQGFIEGALRSAARVLSTLNVEVPSR